MKNKTYTAKEIAARLNITVARVHVIAKGQDWPYYEDQDWLYEDQAQSRPGRKARHYDAATVDEYIANRPPQPESSGHPQRSVTIAVEDEEFEEIKKLSPRERAEKLLG